MCTALSEALWRGRGILKKLSLGGGRRDHPHSGTQMSRSPQRNRKHGSNCVEEEGWGGEGWEMHEIPDHQREDSWEKLQPLQKSQDKEW